MRTQGMGVLSCAVVLSLSACGQVADREPSTPKDSLALRTDTPKTDIRVNKQYDEHGNLIAYDSTYTSFYQGGGDPLLMDSLFNAFKPRFDHRYPMLTDPSFNDLFFNDSLLYQDFFHHDFFQKRMKLNEQYMQRMMREMDVFKNQFFKNQPSPPVRGDTAKPPER